MRRTCLSWLLVLSLAFPPGAFAQSAATDAVYRVFLKTGEALPSFGEPATVGDRVVFNLIVGVVTDTPRLQLVNLPLARIDAVRTGRYQETKRAAVYGETRGEAGYAAMTDTEDRSGAPPHPSSRRERSTSRNRSSTLSSRSTLRIL